jgi:glycine oxidase
MRSDGEQRRGDRGGGIVGMTTLYYLARAGVASVVVERDAIGSHASGFAYGGLSPLSGLGIPGPLAEVAHDGMRLHRELAETVVEETGIGIDFSPRPSLAPAFTEGEARRLKSALPWQREQSGCAARWLDPAEARRVEPRVADDAIGAALIEGGADVEPYRLVLALTRAGERMGVTVRHGRVTGLARAGGRVTGVVLERGEVASSAVVLALGPWSADAAPWLDMPIPVRPLNGADPPAPGAWPARGLLGGLGPQLRHDQARRPPLGGHHGGGDGLRRGDDTGAALVKMLPSMADARLAHQTACLRPLASDGLLLLGRVPGLDRVYMATGAGRKGILLGPSMVRAVADLILTGSAKVALDTFAPDRFRR